MKNINKTLIVLAVLFMSVWTFAISTQAGNARHIPPTQCGGGSSLMGTDLVMIDDHTDYTVPAGKTLVITGVVQGETPPSGTTVRLFINSQRMINSIDLPMGIPLGFHANSGDLVQIACLDPGNSCSPLPADVHMIVTGFLVDN